MKTSLLQTKKRVIFLTFPGVKLLDVTGPFQAFSDASLRSDMPPLYDPVLTSLNGGIIQTDTAISLETHQLDAAMDKPADIFLIAGGRGVDLAVEDQRLVEAVSRYARKANRIASVCSGALLLARTGLLEGRRVATHWGRCNTFQEDHPGIDLQPDPVFVKDGNIWTSAGVTAGIDMTLAIIKEDFGARTALAVARELVVYMARPGGQSQFSMALDHQLKDAENRFDRLHQWIRDHLSSDLRVEKLANYMNMSSRTFARLYKEKTGLTPAKAVEAIRIETARNFLEETSLPISTLAARCGFLDDERMRRAFIRQLGVSPSDYRQRFGTAV